MKFITVANQLQLAIIDTDFLDSFLTQLNFIESPLLDEMRLTLSIYRMQFKRGLRENAANRIMLHMLRIEINKLFQSMLGEVGFHLESILKKQIKTNNDTLTEIDYLEKERYLLIDSQKLDDLENQTETFEETSVTELLKQLATDFANQRKRMNSLLLVKVLSKVEFSKICEHYTSSLNLANSSLNKLITSLQNPVTLHIPKSSAPNEYVWTEKDIALELAKIERHHLLSIFALVTPVLQAEDLPQNLVDEYTNLKMTLEKLTTPLDFASEDEEECVELEQSQELRNKMGFLHCTVINATKIMFHQIIIKKNKEINNALATLIEARDNFRNMDEAAALNYPRNDFLITPFHIIQCLLFRLNGLKTSLALPLTQDLGFEQTPVQNGDGNHTDQMHAYEQRLVLNLQHLHLLVQKFNMSNSLCASADDVYERSYPLQRLPATPDKTAQEKNNPKKRTSRDEDDELDMYQSPHKAAFLLFNQEMSDKEEAHFFDMRPSGAALPP